MWPWLLALLAVTVTALKEDDYIRPKFLLFSSPLLSKIGFAKIDQLGLEVGTPSTLISGGGALHAPSGLCLDKPRLILYVCDPGAKARKIFAFQLYVDPQSADKGSPQLSASTEPKIVAQNTEAKWCAVDQVGNLFYSDEGSNSIKTITAQILAQEIVDAMAPTMLYSSMEQLALPGGVAVDNWSLYWGNQEKGATSGTVCRALEAGGTTAPTVTAVNADAAQGVCMGRRDIFFTEKTANLHGFRRGTANQTVLLSSAFKEPRGCSWDGDGSIYVADQKAGVVYSIPADMDKLETVTPASIVDFDNVFDVAVVTALSSAAHISVLGGLLLALAFNL